MRRILVSRKTNDKMEVKKTKPKLEKRREENEEEKGVEKKLGREINLLG